MPKRKTDVFILFTTRIVRLFCFGFLSVVLALYLAQVGMTDWQIGLLFTLTLAGDAGKTLWLTTSADRFGRKRAMLVGVLLMIVAGLVFILTKNPVLLMIAAIMGVISPSGNDIGPCLSVEQACLSQLVPNQRRTQTFAWFTLAGSFAAATGALLGGWLPQILQNKGVPAVEAYRTVLMGYTLGGLVLVLVFLFLSSDIEVPAKTRAYEDIKRTLGLHKSRNTIFHLSALFSLDAFAGALTVQSLIAFWFNRRFGIDTGLIGSVFFGANLLGGIATLLAGRLANRFGLIRTMVYTQIPANILLMLVPLMPTLPLAIGIFLLRSGIGQMDVPTSQSFTMAMVSPDERSAASGVTSIARSVGGAISPSLTGFFLSVPFLFSAPFFLAGGLKLIYDLLLYRGFHALKLPEEVPVSSDWDASQFRGGL